MFRWDTKPKHIHREDNVPADLLSWLQTNTQELQDIDHYIPVQTIELKAVQARNEKLRMAQDSVKMADQAKEDPDYRELIRKIEEGVNFESYQKTTLTNATHQDGRISEYSTRS